jgi:hypothetical protein
MTDGALTPEYCDWPDHGAVKVTTSDGKVFYLDWFNSLLQPAPLVCKAALVC